MENLKLYFKRHEKYFTIILAILCPIWIIPFILLKIIWEFCRMFYIITNEVFYHGDDYGLS
jgi:hypothetical protein